MKDPQRLKQILKDLKDKYANELESHAIISSDFYYQNPIMRALRNEAPKTATILIEFILDMDTNAQYTTEFMKALPMILA
jgi:hypothetical protein